MKNASSANVPAPAEFGLTMSSLEIAGLTGKRHDHVLRDADKMLEELGEGNAPKFGGVYRDAKGEERRCLNLPKRECPILVSGARPIAAKAMGVDCRQTGLRQVTHAPATP